MAHSPEWHITQNIINSFYNLFFSTTDVFIDGRVTAAQVVLVQGRQRQGDPEHQLHPHPLLHVQHAAQGGQGGQ